jgi:hypothetical protein
MNEIVIMWLKFIGLMLFILLVIFFVFWFIRRMYLRRLKSIKCEIFLNSGDRITLNNQIEEKSFTYQSASGNIGRYIIPKEAIRKNIQKGKIKSNVSFFLQYFENVAYPFLNIYENKTWTKTFLGAERCEQMYKEKIWKEVGGIGGSGMSMLLTIVGIIIVVIVVIGIIYVLTSHGGTPVPAK